MEFDYLKYFLVAAGLYLLWKIIGIRVIPNNKIGIVEKWWSPKGALKEQIIALNGESGFQPELLRGGIHFYSPLKYKVHISPLVTIPQGQIGYVFARDGVPLEPTQTLGKVVPEGDNFQDVRGFIACGGQKGPQRGIIREGVYAFNLAMFIVITENSIYYLPSGEKSEISTITQMSESLNARNGFRPIIIDGELDKVGIVTIHDGPSLNKNDIIAPTVGDNSQFTDIYHNNFQDTEKFLKAGGFRGRQHQVLVEGTYFLNRLFGTVEMIEKTIIEVGFVGVIVSYIGEKGMDSSGDDYHHGELVDVGYRGVWKDALMPGKYAFNTYAGKIVRVPTVNVILKWITNQTGTHRYDENLKEVNLITKDAFEPSLPLSVVMHIDYKKAPMVIQRFGDIKMLVDQTLDPMVSAYFKNVGQARTLIQLIQDRNEIQDISSKEMKLKFAHYNLELEEVLIGTPASSINDDKIETILAQLRDRQVALEQVETYTQQQKAAEKEREYKEAESKAQQQKFLTESDINIQIQSNQGKAEYQRALQEANKIKTIAEAESSKIRSLSQGEAAKIKAIAEAEAEKEARVGIAKAIAIEEQVRAYGGPKYQLVQDVMNRFTSALEKNPIDLVPKTLITMGGDKGGGSANAFETLMALIINEKLSQDMDAIPATKTSDDISIIKKSILASIEKNKNQENNPLT